MIAASAVFLSVPMIAPALAALLGACLLVRGFLLLADQRPKSAPLSKIGGITPGPVEVHGTATGPYSITAPITGKTCYLYRTAVWQQKQSQTQGWEKLADETLHVPFFLDDTSGKLLIEPLGAELQIRIALREEFAAAAFFGASEIPPAVSVFLARHRVTPTHHILIEEFCVEPQSNLFVTGTVTENTGVEVKPLVPRRANGFTPQGKEAGQSLSDAPEVVRLSSPFAPLASDATTQQSKIAAALAKAGIQNPNAWAAAGVPYPGPESASVTAVLHEEPASPGEHEAAKASETPSGFNLKPPLVLMSGASDTAFVLSSRKIEQPARPSRRTALVLLAAGGALTLASLWIFLAKVF